MTLLALAGYRIDAYWKGEPAPSFHWKDAIRAALIRSEEWERELERRRGRKPKRNAPRGGKRKRRATESQKEIHPLIALIRLARTVK